MHYPERKDPSKQLLLKFKRISLGIIAAFIILTLLTFFKTGLEPQYKLLLSFFILINGIILGIGVFTLIKKHYSLIGTISGLLIILGILPIMVGLSLTTMLISLKIPLLLYQVLSLAGSLYYIYLLFRKPADQDQPIKQDIFSSNPEKRSEMNMERPIILRKEESNYNPFKKENPFSRPIKKMDTNNPSPKFI